MNLYQALQGVLEKIKRNSEEGRYASEERTQLRAVLENQERLAEAILIVGGLLQAVVEREVDIEMMASAEEQKH